MPAECRTRSFTHSHHPLWTLPSSAICSSTLPREAPGSCSRFCFSWPFSSPLALGGDDGGGLASRDRSPARLAGAALVAALTVRARPTIVFPRRRPRVRGGFMEPLPGPAPRRHERPRRAHVLDGAIDRAVLAQVLGDITRRVPPSCLSGRSASKGSTRKIARGSDASTGGGSRDPVGRRARPELDRVSPIARWCSRGETRPTCPQMRRADTGACFSTRRSTGPAGPAARRARSAIRLSDVGRHAPTPETVRDATAHGRPSGARSITRLHSPPAPRHITPGTSHRIPSRC
jgi:hypothetical protein